jgi:hypothetical protein
MYFSHAKEYMSILYMICPIICEKYMQLKTLTSHMQETHITIKKKNYQFFSTNATLNIKDGEKKEEKKL